MQLHQRLEDNRIRAKLSDVFVQMNKTYTQLRKTQRQHIRSNAFIPRTVLEF